MVQGSGILLCLLRRRMFISVLDWRLNATVFPQRKVENPVIIKTRILWKLYIFNVMRSNREMNLVMLIFRKTLSERKRLARVTTK